MNIEGLKNTFQYGMHGCGYYKGTNHVNSLDALKYWRSQGVKVMEIDMAKTPDGGFVALAHLMNKHYLNLVELDLPSNTEDATEEWFVSNKLCNRTTNGLSPMSLPMIIELMESDSELIIMFDLWRMWRMEDTYSFSNRLLELFHDNKLMNRCVIEVYNREMIRGIKKADNRLNIMYCVHAPREPEFEEDVSPLILKNFGIDIISYPWSFIKQYPGELESYKEQNFTVFSLSVDNRYHNQMKKAGVNVNLVDVLYSSQNFISLAYQKIKKRLALFIK